MNGGYTLIDMTGVDLNDLGTKTGLYNTIKAAVKASKPMVLCGLVNNTQAFSPIVAYGGEESSTSVFVSFFPVTLHVDSDDAITM